MTAALGLQNNWEIFPKKSRSINNNKLQQWLAKQKVNEYKFLPTFACTPSARGVRDSGFIPDYICSATYSEINQREN